MPATEEQTEEHPIIFNGWSIRRILAGDKHMTRRIVKPQPEEVDPPNRQTWTPERKWLRWKKIKQTSGSLAERCPYGQPGDVLWVREAFRVPKAYDDMSPRKYVDEVAFDDGFHPVQYEADESDTIKWISPKGRTVEWGRKRPSIYMPRELCRLRLRVEDVRVERLQEISPDDADAEGIKPLQQLPYEPKTVLQAQRVQGESLITEFADKWRQIHGDGAWDENPHVWAVEFSKIDTE